MDPAGEQDPASGHGNAGPVARSPTAALANTITTTAEAVKRADALASSALVEQPPTVVIEPGELLREFLAGRSPETARAYAGDLLHFAGAMHLGPPGSAVAQLLRHGPGHANRLAEGYRNRLVEQGFAAATVNRRLAALRSVVRLARRFGLVTWALDVRGFRKLRYRDTRGPGADGVRAILSAAEQLPEPRRSRDRLVVRLLFDLALRRAEVAALDVADVDLARGLLFARQKGAGHEKGLLTLPVPTQRALEAWLASRTEAGPELLQNFARAPARRGRLTARSIYRVVAALGRRAGLGLVRPHGLRHAGITRALDLSGRDVRSVRSYSRHADLNVLLAYDDRRQDVGGQLAARVADLGTA